MKRYLLLLSLFAVILSSCEKPAVFSPADQAISDDQAIQAYLKTYSITATKDPSGLYYSIVTPGTGAYPNSTANVSVAYTGKLLDGTQFDTQPSAFFQLPNVIKGWQIGIPHINKGGTIMLFVPSALGYGLTATGSIPANSVLVFTITLQGFNNATN